MSLHDLVVRPARPPDVPALAAIAHHVYHAHFRALLPDADFSDRDLAHCANRIDTSIDRIFLVEVDGDPAGFCIQTGANIDILFVAAGRRGSGAGAALLREAALRGARTLECLAANERALAFYAREGWRVARCYERDWAGGSRAFVEMSPVIALGPPPDSR